LKGINRLEQKDFPLGAMRRMRKKRYVIEHDPMPTCTGKSIVAIRKSLQLTQPEFAKILGVSIQSIKAWETEKSEPSAAAQRLLCLFKKDIGLIYEFVSIQEAMDSLEYAQSAQKE
jgi:Predicted transcriptional regulator